MASIWMCHGRIYLPNRYHNRGAVQTRPQRRAMLIQKHIGTNTLIPLPHYSLEDLRNGDGFFQYRSIFHELFSLSHQKIGTYSLKAFFYFDRVGRSLILGFAIISLLNFMGGVDS